MNQNSATHLEQNISTLVQWIHSKTKKNNPENRIILYVKFFTFSFILFLKTCTYKALFYHNIIKAQRKRSPSVRWKNRIKI